jgi:hypothetical protein
MVLYLNDVQKTYVIDEKKDDDVEVINMYILTNIFFNTSRINIQNVFKKTMEALFNKIDEHVRKIEKELNTLDHLPF